MNTYQQELNNTATRLNNIASNIDINTDVATLTKLRQDIDTISTLATRMRLNDTGVEMVKTTMRSKLHDMFLAISPGVQSPPEDWFDNNKYWISN